MDGEATTLIFHDDREDWIDDGPVDVEIADDFGYRVSIDLERDEMLAIDRETGRSGLGLSAFGGQAAMQRVETATQARTASEQALWAASG